MDEELERAETRVEPSDVLNMQFTSGKIICIKHLALRHSVQLLTYYKELLAYRKSPCSRTSKKPMPAKPSSIY